eukprot:TRINITY_DN9790_c0_g1_i9.p1 TRINITY_DN9790_c0_g1~~TRINITY_DN9790_c0_g1_i9.p1  ORF type:complete len:129 (+),score=19.74 TRINITY_DN9790_c0_g1_i9:86-472(+)
MDELTKEITNIGSYQTTFGLTGTVFTKNTPAIGSFESNKQLFQPIDYCPALRSIVNFLFLPLYGYKEEVVGVLKLFNRENGLPTLSDVKEFEPYQRSIGLMVKHIQETKNTTGSSLTIKKLLQRLEAS